MKSLLFFVLQAFLISCTTEITINQYADPPTFTFSVRAGDSRVDLWFSQSDLPDFQGFLIVRNTNSILFSPVSGITYAMNNVLGDNSIVLYDGSNTYASFPYCDTNTIAGVTYYYKMWPYAAGVVYWTNGITFTARPGPYADGWIGGGQDGWQFGDGASWGTGQRYFRGLLGIAMYQKTNMYFPDANSRVNRWTTDGTNRGWLGGGQDGWQTGVGAAIGSGYRFFNNLSPAVGIASDSSGYLYVSDYGNNRFQRWSAGAVAMGLNGDAATGWGITNSTMTVEEPHGVALDGNGFIYVAERGGHRVSKWTTSGMLIGRMGTGLTNWSTSIGLLPGISAYHFTEPVGIAIGPQGSIYVADYGNARVCRWDSDAANPVWIGGGQNGWRSDDAVGGGDSLNSFSAPTGLFVATNGDIYVSDAGNYRIIKWSADGTPIGWIGEGSPGWKTGVPTRVISTAYDYFNWPHNVYIDYDSGYLYVLEWNNHRVSRWRLWDAVIRSKTNTIN